jgi:hypothetical protein
MSRQRDVHEPYAVAAGTLHWSAAILAGSLLLVVLGMYELSQHWLHLQPAAPVATMPPQPRLQPDPAGDIAAERAQQQTRLDRYEWIDRDVGIARIPIARAMALMAKQPATAPASDRKQEPKQERPLTPPLSPGKGAGRERAKQIAEREASR